MNAPMIDAFDCSSREAMRKQFVSGFPRALLPLSQEKSFKDEIGLFAIRKPKGPQKNFSRVAKEVKCYFR